MNEELLNLVLENNDFLKAYLKQFRNNLSANARIMEIGKNSNKYLDYLKSLGCDISKQKKYEGLIIINTFLFDEKAEELYKQIDDLLDDKGFVFLVIHNKGKIKERLMYLLLDNYLLVQEYIGDENWKFLLYQKSTIK